MDPRLWKPCDAVFGSSLALTLSTQEEVGGPAQRSVAIDRRPTSVGTEISLP